MTEESKLDPPWPYREVYYTGVGQSISAWANMETTIVRIFALVMHTTDEKAGLVLYSIMNFNTWLAVTSELMALDKKYSEFTDSWNKKAERLRSLNDTRVRLAHHTVWESDPNDWGVKPSRLDTRAKAKKYKALSIGDLKDFSDKQEKISIELFDLCETMRAHGAPDLSPLAKLLQRPVDRPALDSQSHPSPTAPEDPPLS